MQLSQNNIGGSYLKKTYSNTLPLFLERLNFKISRLVSSYIIYLYIVYEIIYENLYHINSEYFYWGIVLSAQHREFKKNFQTEITVNGKKLPLNHFIEETVANLIVGLLKTLKEDEEPEKLIEIKIKNLWE